MTTDPLFIRIIEAIEQAQGGRFKVYAEALKRSTFKPKPWWMPFKDSITTIDHTIYIIPRFYNENFRSQCRWIVHEAVHVKDYEIKGLAMFMAEYATPWGRKRIEQTAEIIAGQW